MLLGTAGGCNPKSTRCGYANAVVVGDAAYLVDCGEGAHRQMWRAGLTMNPASTATRPVVKAIFVTHLHADHIMDLANLFVGSWPPHAVDVFGPAPAGLPIPAFPPDARAPFVYPDEPTPGTRATVEHLLRAFAYNINLRVPTRAASTSPNPCGCARSGFAATATCPTSTSASSPTARATEVGGPRWSRSSSIPKTSTACR